MTDTSEVDNLKVGEQVEHTVHHIEGERQNIVLNYVDEGCIQVFVYIVEGKYKNSIQWEKTYKTMEEAKKEYYRFD